MIPQLFANLILPQRCLIGLQEKLGFVGEREVARTVNGRAVVLQPAYGSLYTVELSNAGDHVWLPHRFEIGQQVRFGSTVWHTAVLQPGQTEVVLPREPIAIVARRTVSIRDAVFVTRLGERRFSVPAGPSATILYRLRLDVVVADFQSTGSASGREQSWTMKLEELGG